MLLLTTVATWNDFFLPITVLRGPCKAGAGGERVWNLIVTGSFILVVPLVAAFLPLQKCWQGGFSPRVRPVRRTTQDDGSRIQELTVSMP